MFGKMNVFTLLAAVVVQLVVGYLWFGPHLFGDVVKNSGGHAIDFLQMDVISILLLLLTSYGLTHVLEDLLSGAKDVGGALKNGLVVGGFAIGFPIIMLMNLMGYSHIMLLIVFVYIVIITVLTSIVIVKLRK